MLPTLLSQNIQRGTEDFLRTTFPPSNPFFHGILERFLAEPGAMFKGPYLSMKLPFRPGRMALDAFDGFALPHTPYAHQEEAFARLRGVPRSTLVSTGTGSGKTECFLYPILEYCFKHRGEPGIKAILVYPMNALATDQAQRIAEEIHRSDSLRGVLRAGLFVGGDPAGKASAVMTPTGIITDKNSLRQHPPDILLTNYKMLDYLLIRPQDFPLWKDNQPETLKFFVVDELHTFDGAQGTDLACLIRRLKERVKCPEGHLCGIGTSATLGGGDDLPALRDFAAELFGEPFEESSVITENLLSPGEFFGDSFITRASLPSGEDQARLNPEAYADEAAYLAGQVKVWFKRGLTEPEIPRFRLELAELLMGHVFFRNLVLVLKSDTLALDEVDERLSALLPEFAELSPEARVWILQSMVSLVAWARRGAVDKPRPFLHVRAQLWVRELRRMVASVERNPCLRYADDLAVNAQPAHLPLVHCRECGSMGWTAQKRVNDSHFTCELTSFYRAFFDRSPQVHFLFPAENRPGDPAPSFPQYVCGSCLETGLGAPPEVCPSCGQKGCCLPVEIHNELKTGANNRHYIKHDCPFCRAKDSLTLLGSRSASLMAVGIGQLFASPFYPEPGKKMLAFSNSVQDASHRAGFFEARTFGFNFRSALQKVIAAADLPLTLSALPDAFEAYWRERMPEETFIATFLAPNLAWREEAETFLTGQAQVSDELRTLVRKRIGWEIWSELGFRARIGRTLEKSGGASVFLDPNRLDVAVTALQERLPNEVGVLRGLEAAPLRRFLVGFLHELRVRGAVELPELSGYIREWGNTWMLHRVDHLPGFGPQSRAPAFLTTKPKVDRFDLLTSQGTTPTWSEAWLDRALGERFPAAASFSFEIFREIMPVLVSAGLLVELADEEPRIWGLNREALRVSAGGVQYFCDHCGATASGAGVEIADWEGRPCRRGNCQGHLRVASTEPDYYGRLYRDGLVNRIYTGEHTGLLEREVREEVERHFKEQDLPASPNLLSCTPTLEMGINIGDLSTLLLCGVPPTQANYLQRIGRSGRRDGNAFNLAMAEGKPHDLYFYHDPLEMVAGAVEPPGIFLNAPMVLERQFVGFCFDRWLETGVSVEAFPRKMAKVLQHLEREGDRALFPFNLMSYIEEQRTPLLGRFLEIFAGALSEDAVRHLRDFVEGDPRAEGNLTYKISSRLAFLRQEVESFRKRVKAVQKAIKEREESPAVDQNTPRELDELRKEKAALNRMIAARRDKETFNFFTDEGLLPNYAFPEAGVTLRSIIWRKRGRGEEGKGKFDTRVYEYTRPAAMALRELAPANTFYAESRKVKVDRVSLDLSEVETWRFCSECAHKERVLGGEAAGACPKCGDPLWADAGQVRTMVKFRQVEARTSERESRVDDSSDSREPLFYNEQMQVEVRPEFIQQAWGIDDADTPFGYEFVSKADFRQINFGLGGEAQSTMRVAGRDVPVLGFEVCKGCGKVRPGPGKPFEHAITCRYYGTDKEAPFVNSLYLYREFTSEAVRILLPVTSEGVDVKLHSFVASIYLGLKKRFRGSIDHLQTTIVDEPVPGAAVRKRFLVIFDSVPGGTGYLKELTKTPDTLMEVLETALKVLRTCACGNDEEQDGCYHCLYAFRLSRDLSKISRREAMGVLSEILSRRAQLRSRKSVTDLSVNGLLESELEARFIEALRRVRPHGAPVTMSREVVKGKPGWQLSLSGKIWLIEPQPRLGPENGVSVPCRPDFVFWPIRSNGLRPVAVFTDGFQYHADISQGHLIVDEDVEKRMALLRSGGFRVWSLSWEDVKKALADEAADHLFRWMQFGVLQGRKLAESYEPRCPGLKALTALAHCGAFEGLTAYLGSGSEEGWALQAFVHALSFGKGDYGFCASAESERISGELFKPEHSSLVAPLPGAWSKEGPDFAGVDVLRDELDRPLLMRHTRLGREWVRPEHLAGADVTVRLFDEPDLAESRAFPRAWNTFLQMMNFLQFLPGARFVTTRGLQAGRDDRPAREGLSSGGPSPSGADMEWETEGALLRGSLRPLWQDLHQAGLSLPCVGYEISGDRGEVLGEAEIAWVEARVLLLDSEQVSPGLCDRLLNSGWRVHVIPEGSLSLESDRRTFVDQLKAEVMQ